MGKHSTIEWTDHTFNPWWGCAKVSPACSHCYAERWSKRLGLQLWGPCSPRRFFSAQHWREPILWDRAAKKEGIRRRVFCASMADVFEPRSDLDPWRIKLWELINDTSNLDWLLLTKRPQQVQRLVPWKANWPANIWLGSTVENQEWAEKRIPFLTKIPAHVIFLSCEPLLSQVDLTPWIQNIHWIIVGGESGVQARPLDPHWISDILRQSTANNVAFYFKQWGEWIRTDGIMKRVGKKNAGRLFNGKIWDELPSYKIFSI
jgi:protein gp37